MELKQQPSLDSLKIAEQMANDVCNFSLEEQPKMILTILSIVHKRMLCEIRETETKLEYQQNNLNELKRISDKMEL